MKIIFVLEDDLNERYAEKYGINYFLEKNQKVEILNITPITRRKYYFEYLRKKYKNKNRHKSIKIKTFFKKKDLILNIKKLNLQDIVIAHIGVNNDTEFLIKTLNKYKIKYVQHSLGFLPFPPKSKIEILKLGFKYPIAFLLTIWRRLNIYSTSALIQPTFMCCAGEQAYLSNKKNNKIKTLIKIPCPEYDEYLELKKIKRKIKKKEKYAVLIDSYYDHPDQVYNKENSFPPEKIPSFNEYYDPINNFFKELNKRSNLKVKIGAHPRSDYKKNPYAFGKIYYNQTAELIKDCEFVVVKASLALNFAVLFKKPIVFILNDFWKYNTKRQIIHVAKYFKQEPINITNLNNKNFNFLKKRKINYLAYKNFAKNFINNINNTKKKYSSHEILLNNIKK